MLRTRHTFPTKANVVKQFKYVTYVTLSSGLMMLINAIAYRILTHRKQTVEISTPMLTMMMILNAAKVCCSSI